MSIKILLIWIVLLYVGITGYNDRTGIVELLNSWNVITRAGNPIGSTIYLKVYEEQWQNSEVLKYLGLCQDEEITAGWSGSWGRFDGNKKKCNGYKDNTIKKDDDKFAWHQVGKQLTVAYDTVKEQIKQYIQKSYSQGIDLAESIREGTYKDLGKVKPQKHIEPWLKKWIKRRMWCL